MASFSHLPAASKDTPPVLCFPRRKNVKIDDFPSLDDVKEKPVEYLYPGLIPRGQITVIEGPPGNNKSSLACYIAAYVTNGKPMPYTMHKGRQPTGGAIFLIGEDDLATTVAPRCRAAGADLAKIRVPQGKMIPDHLEEIESAIRKSGATMLVIDTIDDFFSCSTVANQAVRRVLGELRGVAERTNAAIILIRHFAKKSAGNSLLRGLGAVAIAPQTNAGGSKSKAIL
jgi:predicted ATP-dependent serine protease